MSPFDAFSVGPDMAWRVPGVSRRREQELTVRDNRRQTVVDRSVKGGATLAGMRRKLTPRGRERRDQLMECGARLFAERGYHPTSVADIVAALGVGKGVFYWYFASKEELLTELLKASNHDLRKRQQHAIGDEADPMRRIELGIRASLLWFAEHREYFAIIQFAATDETFAPVLARNREIVDRRHDPPPERRHRRRPHRRSRPRAARARHPRRRGGADPACARSTATCPSTRSPTSASRSASKGSVAEVR